tara:strand:- start:594 stop:770 length:177 start_codon:yes stop_codon:yes gene_type:complete
MSIEKISAALEKKIEDFCSNHGMHEPDTNAFVFDSDAAEAYCEGLSDALEIVHSTNGA